MDKLASILARLADIACGDIGKAFESPRGSNCGPTLAKYFKADDYEPGRTDEGYPWCAAAVCCWVQEFLRDETARLFFAHIVPPRTAAAFGFIDWAKKQGCLIFTPQQCNPNGYWPQRGDIVVYSFSHIGVVTVGATRAKDFAAVEGNTDKAGSREGWEVAQKPRSFATRNGRNEVRAFIRFTPRVPPGKSLS